MTVVKGVSASGRWMLVVTPSLGAQTNRIPWFQKIAHLCHTLSAQLGRTPELRSAQLA